LRVTIRTKTAPQIPAGAEKSRRKRQFMTTTVTTMVGEGVITDCVDILWESLASLTIEIEKKNSQGEFGVTNKRGGKSKHR